VRDVRLLNEAASNIFGNTWNDFVLDCQFGGRSCLETTYTEFSSEKYGRCYTLFAGGQEFQIEVKIRLEHNVSQIITGPDRSLELTLNVNSDEYIGMLSNCKISVQLSTLYLKLMVRECKSTILVSCPSRERMVWMSWWGWRHPSESPRAASRD